MTAPWNFVRSVTRKTNMCKGGISIGNRVICVAVGLLTPISFFVYLSIFLGCGYLREVLHEVCGDLRHGSDAICSAGKPNHTQNLSNGGRNGLTAEIASTSIGLTEHNVNKTDENPKKLQILVGVLTTASKVHRRNLLRLAYGVQSSEDAEVTVRFVLGALTGEQENILVGMEMVTHGDILVLECEENLNYGKTFTYFSSLPSIGKEYDYVMKTDDDSYVRFDNLARHLKLLPRTDLYYGFILGCNNKNAYDWYMAGMGYVISWDLVEWIRASPIPRNRSIGTEDELVGQWFNEGGKAKNRVNDKPLFYDHPDFGGDCAHELIPQTILIHQLKTTEHWVEVMTFFEKQKVPSGLATESTTSTIESAADLS